MTATATQEKKKPLTGEQLGDFCDQMAAMLHSGCTPADSCGALAQDGADAVACAAGEMTGLLEEGWSFAYSAEKTGVFPTYALGVFTTAEQSGRLEESLDRLADYYRRQESLQTRMRSVLTYPAALLGMMCAVLGVLVFWVIPMFRGVYGSLTGSLASSAYAYVSAAGVIGVVGLVISGVMAAALVALSLILGSSRGQEALLPRLQKLPLTRNAFRGLALSQLTDTLSTLLASGTDPVSAMELALSQCTHDGLRASLAGSETLLSQGEGFARVLSPVLPARYARLLRVGEAGGSLADALATLSRQMGTEAEGEIQKLIDGTEPVLMGFLTLTVGMTLLSVMLPLLGILGAV